MDVNFIAVAHREHPLLKAGRALSADDLARYTQSVVRDSGTLVMLLLSAGATRRLPLYLILARSQAAVPAAQRAAELFLAERPPKNRE